MTSIDKNLEKRYIHMNYSDDYIAILNLDKEKISKIIESSESDYLRALGYASLGKTDASLFVISSVDKKPISEDDRRYLIEANLINSIYKATEEKKKVNALFVLHEYPDSLYANFYLSDFSKEKGDWQSAYDYLEKCLALFPESENFHFQALALASKIKRKDLFLLHKAYIKRLSRRFVYWIGLNTAVQVILFIFLFGLITLFESIKQNIAIIPLIPIVVFWLRLRKQREIFLTKILWVCMYSIIGYYYVKLILTLFRSVGWFIW